MAQQSRVNPLTGTGGLSPALSGSEVSAVAYAYDDANRLLGVSTGATVYDPLTAVA